MKTINVSLKENPYPIYIGEGVVRSVGQKLKDLKLGTDAIVITSPKIFRLHGRTLIHSLKKANLNIKVLSVPDGEKSKSAAGALSLLGKIARYDVMKKVFIVAFGGGVIGDLAGFVASIYRRGIPYIQIPTTLLAQVDSAIGGKVAIDLDVGKNLVGAFYQPKMVVSDITFLKTLPGRQIRNGLAEVIKYGIIKDKTLFDYLEKNIQDLLRTNLKSLKYVIETSSRIKAQVVMADEKETKELRHILNFGHTLGHAIETAGKYELYHHGEAIALGMRMAAYISRRQGLLPLKDDQRINGVISQAGLPKRLTKLKIPDILRVMQHDKKFLAGQNRFVLAKTIGSVTLVKGVKKELIRAAVECFRQVSKL